MELTAQEQSMFDGETGEATRQSMEILLALGKIYGAKRMVPVTSAQIAGVSYKTIGEAGLSYLNDMAKNGARVRVPSFLNPAGMDREQWKEMKVPEAFAKKQLEVLAAYAKMGIAQSCTCTPYLVGIRPKVGEHVAWSESSAVVFCNSVLGARTAREGGPSALAAAICGATPEYGYHLDENRVCDFAAHVECLLSSSTDFGALGACVGGASKGKNVAFTGIKSASDDRLKTLGASMAAWGSNALFNMKGITPEFSVAEKPEKITIGKKEISEMKSKMGLPERPQIVAIGCPHASLDEISEVASLVKGKKVGCELWVCTARQTKEKADKAGFTAAITQAGGRVVADTCMVVCPLEDMGFHITACNSGKAAKYLQTLQKQKVVFGDLGDIIFR